MLMFSCRDLGAHIDGFPAVVAHSFVVNATAENKATGKKADAVLAAYYAAEAAMRKLKPGNENYSVSASFLMHVFTGFLYNMN